MFENKTLFNLFTIIMIILFIATTVTIVTNYKEPDLSGLPFFNEYPFLFEPFFFTLFIGQGIYVVKILLDFLQSGNGKDYQYTYKKELFSDELNEIKHTNRMLKKSFSKLQHEFNETAVFIRNSQLLKDEDREKVLAQASEKLSEFALEQWVSEMLKELSKKDGSAYKLSEFYNSIHEVKERINSESFAIGRRSNINLLLGMSITIFAIGILVWAGQSSTEFFVNQQGLKELKSESINALLAAVLPRLTLGLLVQAIAFFFLRLYKAGLDSIKYYQNEMTNLESRFLALRYAEMKEDTDLATSIIGSLANTERNFVLKKDETTVELERAKSESELMRNLIEAIPGIIKGEKSK